MDSVECFVGLYFFMGLGFRGYKELDLGSPHEGLGHHKAPYESGRSGLQGFGVYSALGPECERSFPTLG